MIQTGSQFLTGWSHSDRSYDIDYLPYFDDLNHSKGPVTNTSISVAFIGNSMQYYNDLPRLLVEMSEANITQNSCYRPGTSLKTIATHGNGMPNYWNTFSSHQWHGSLRLGASRSSNYYFKDNHLETGKFSAICSRQPCPHFRVLGLSQQLLR
jgi:hypothetical protein